MPQAQGNIFYFTDERGRECHADVVAMENGTDLCHNCKDQAPKTEYRATLIYRESKLVSSPTEAEKLHKYIRDVHLPDLVACGKEECQKAWFTAQRNRAESIGIQI
jgi:hypothetical protein